MKLTAADVYSLPPNSMYRCIGPHQGPNRNLFVVVKDRIAFAEDWHPPRDPAWTDRCEFELVYCPDPSWVPPSQHQPWRAKCYIGLISDGDKAGRCVRWNYRAPLYLCVDDLEWRPRLNHPHQFFSDEAAALAALALADPPPKCMEPDAVAERCGIEDAKAGKPQQRWRYASPWTLTKWEAYTRGFNRQRAKMEAQPAKPPFVDPDPEESAPVNPRYATVASFRDVAERALIAMKDPQDPRQDWYIVAEAIYSEVTRLAPAKPDEFAAEREAIVQRAERHCYTLPAGGYVQWNWKSHADFALTELAAANAEIVHLKALANDPIARLQFPDGSCAGNIASCAKGWKAWYDKAASERDALRANAPLAVYATGKEIEEAVIDKHHAAMKLDTALAQFAKEAQ